MSRVAPDIIYREHPPGGVLAPYVTSCWSFENDDAGARAPAAGSDCGIRLPATDPLLNTILPEPGLCVVLNFGGAWRVRRAGRTVSMPRAAVMGSVTRPWRLRLSPPVSAVGIVVDPTVAEAVLTVRPATLVDRVVSLETAWGSRAVNSFYAEVAKLTNPWARIERLTEMLSGRLMRTAPAGPLSEAMRVIRDCDGMATVADVAARCQISRQHLRRLFAMTLGLRPKTVIRMVRLQAVVQKLLEQQSTRLSGLNVGHFDQSHLITDFKSLVGATPRQFFGFERRSVQ